MYILEAKDLSNRFEYVPEPVDKILAIDEKNRYVEITRPRGEYVVGSVPRLFSAEEIKSFSPEFLSKFKVVLARRKYKVQIKESIVKANDGEGEVYVPFPVDGEQFFSEEMKYVEAITRGIFIIGFEPHIFSEGEVANFPASLYEVCDIISVSARPQVEII